ncbi:MAG TPA: hypothetical protein VHW24_27895, partial [Bryobacteraceae bacterium]|nr:hypothetical protein [Bryobacteraceae bacterium]
RHTISKRRLRNFTQHAQSVREQSVAADADYDLQLTPEGVTVEPGRGGLEVAAQIQADRLFEACAEGSVVLIGGHTGLWVRALEILRERRVERPALAYFDTRRLRDPEVRFVFEPEGLVIIENTETPRNPM